MKNWSEIDEKYAEGYDDGYRAGLQRSRKMVDVPSLRSFADEIDARINTSDGEDMCCVCVFSNECSGVSCGCYIAETIREAFGVVE